MALLFNYSFNNITAINQTGLALAGYNGSPTIGVGDGPQGVNTLHTDGKTSWGYVPNVAIPINAQGLVVGAGFNVTLFGGQTVALYAIGSSGGGKALNLLVGADGSMQLLITGGSPISSASGIFTFGNRHEVELEVSSFSNSGTVSVILDGVAVTALTAVSTGSLTQLNDGATIHTVAVGGAGLGGTTTGILVDSIYALDTTGSFCNAPLGPCISGPLIPNGIGQESQWTANGAALGWECISEIPPDNDTTYISSNTANQEETAAVSVPSYLTGVYGITIIGDMRQDTSGGGRTIELGWGNGTSRVYGSAFGLGTSYVANSQPFSSNGIASRAWNLSDLSSFQVAAKLAS